MSTHLLSRKKCLEESLHLSNSTDITGNTMQPTIPEPSMSVVYYVWGDTMSIESVSYTHLTLPTIYSV